MRETLLVVGYGFAVVLLGWLESHLLRAIKLGGKWGTLCYAIPTNLFCSVIAPIGVLAGVAAGFLGVFSQINNNQHTTAKDAFGSWAGPLMAFTLGSVVVIRVMPLVLMNLKSPIKAILYAILSSAVLALLFTITGFVLIAALDQPKAG